MNKSIEFVVNQLLRALTGIEGRGTNATVS